MPATRLFLIVLILLNLLAFAAGRGWLGTSETRGEPERLTNQINPERIVLRPDLADPRHPATAPNVRIPAPPPTDTLSAESAPTRAQDPDICIAYVVDAPSADIIERLAATPVRVGVARSIVDEPGNWWVRIPPAVSLQVAEQTVQTLRDLGVADLFVVRDAGPNQFAISLGVFRTEARARQHLAALTAKGVDGADIAPRDPATERVEISGPRSTLDTLSATLARRLPNLTGMGCRP